jgi:hypothetical protein
MTLQMSVTGLVAWSLYFVVFALPDFHEKVRAPFISATRELGVWKTALLYATHAVSRGLTSKGIMGIVRVGGSTALSLAQVTRASVIVVLSHFLFCADDARQCLDRGGVFSAALVVAGGALFAAAKHRNAVSKTEASKRRTLRETSRASRTGVAKTAARGVAKTAEKKKQR